MARNSRDWQDEESAHGENAAYLTDRLITCIGNKRLLLSHLDKAVRKVKSRLGRKTLRMFDAFSGSGVVSRLFKQHAEILISNDLEAYASVAGRCSLRNRSEVDFVTLREIISYMNEYADSITLPPGFIEDLYAPKVETAITPKDRVFYTKRNARRLDNYRRMLEAVDSEYRDLVLGPLLSEASVHVNTAGVFKGFYKDGKTGIGRFGGSNGDALTRIMGGIRLEAPTLSNFECEVEVRQADATKVAKEFPSLDVAYLDPPYNQHPYGSNYFMLNLLVDYRRPREISRVSGIPTDWRRSDYNVRTKCLPRLKALIDSIDAPFLLISFNNEGFISPDNMTKMLSRLGKVEVIDIPYNAFRGSRNLEKRSIYVTEHLFLVERH